MPSAPSNFIRYLFGSSPDARQGASNRLIARWLFLRALGLIYFSVFFSLLFQIRGLIGPQGILPAGQYLDGSLCRLYLNAESRYRLRRFPLGMGMSHKIERPYPATNKLFPAEKHISVDAHLIDHCKILENCRDP